MEMGGNYRVNQIFEAHLARSGVRKPSNHADGPTRERFIRDKYERRKFYDPAGYLNDDSPPPATYASSEQSQMPPRPGAPSEAARQRVASRQARMKPSQSNEFEDVRHTSRRQQIAKAPASAPLVFDLLDFSADPTPAPAPASQGSFHDPFDTPSAPSAASGALHDPFATTGQQQQQVSDPFAQGMYQMNQQQQSQHQQMQMQPSNVPIQIQQPIHQQQQHQQQQQQQQQPSNTIAAQESATRVDPFQSIGQAQPATQSMPAKSSESIMALFNASPPVNTGMGMQAMAGMMPTNNGGMVGMTPQQPSNAMNAMGGYSNPSMVQQGGMNNMNQMQQMMGINPMFMNPQMMNMYQQQMMMQQQQQHQQHQQQQHMNHMMGNQMNMMGMMNNNAMGGMMGGGGMMGTNNTGNFNAMMQGMQNFNLGGSSPQKHDDDGVFGNGAPMGGAAPSAVPTDQKQDPFASLGGMNAFR